MTDSTLLKALSNRVVGADTNDPLNIARPLQSFLLNNGAVALAVVPITDSITDGFGLTTISLHDNADNVPTIGTAQYVGAVSRLTGFDPVAGDWDRLRTAPDNADAQAALTQGLQATIARMQGWNGATWDRIKTLSAANLAAFLGVGGLVTAGPGEWAIQHTPAAATQATITRAAGGAGVRHVCRSVTCSILATAAQGQIILNLRDGATGAGTILWSSQFSLGAASSDRITLSGLNIVGSGNTAMTLEVAAAPAATNFASVALTGYDAS